MLFQSWYFTFFPVNQGLVLTYIKAIDCNMHQSFQHVIFQGWAETGFLAF